MTVISELLRVEADNTLSFGDYSLADKTKLDNFEFQGDLYKVKTFKEITKLEKNGMFAYESVPGTAVEKFRATEETTHGLVKFPFGGFVNLVGGGKTGIFHILVGEGLGSAETG